MVLNTKFSKIFYYLLQECNFNSSCFQISDITIFFKNLWASLYLIPEPLWSNTTYFLSLCLLPDLPYHQCGMSILITAFIFFPNKLFHIMRKSNKRRGGGEARHDISLTFTSVCSSKIINTFTATDHHQSMLHTPQTTPQQSATVCSIMLGHAFTPVPYIHSMSLISKETRTLWLAGNTRLISVITAQMHINSYNKTN